MTKPNTKKTGEKKGCHHLQTKMIPVKYAVVCKDCGKTIGNLTKVVGKKV